MTFVRIVTKNYDGIDNQWRNNASKVNYKKVQMIKRVISGFVVEILLYNAKIFRIHKLILIINLNSFDSYTNINNLFKLQIANILT